MLIEQTKARAVARVGATVGGEYRLDALLGLGGMAAVYAARHRSGAPAAIKILHAELASLPDIRARFSREASIANAIEHPGVVRVLGSGEDLDGTVYLVMELVQGETLETRWERASCRLEPREAVHHASALLDVLAAAHDKGVVHRDVKPENVLLAADGGLKLTDFGIARVADWAATHTGKPLGTPAFMAPEQAGGRTNEIGPCTDVWAVGAVLFVLLSGEPVHPARTPHLQMIYAATQRPRSLLAAARWLDPALARVVDRALAFEVAQRWPSARAMRAALEGAR